MADAHPSFDNATYPDGMDRSIQSGNNAIDITGWYLSDAAGT